jgi:3-hydroxy-9,10-secoandrosta-1,3,5(10)-triene-9,17-dione monooxygenase
MDIAKKRVSTNTGKATRQDTNSILAVARTQSAIDEMKAVLYRNFDDMMSTMRAGSQLSMEQRIRYRYQSSQIVRRCADLIDELMPLLGGRAIYTDSPVVRYWLDTNAARAHVANHLHGQPSRALLARHQRCSCSRGERPRPRWHVAG